MKTDTSEDFSPIQDEENGNLKPLKEDFSPIHHDENGNSKPQKEDFSPIQDDENENSNSKKDDFSPIQDDENENSKPQEGCSFTGLRRSTAKRKKKTKSKRFFIYLLLAQALDQTYAGCTASTNSVAIVPRCPRNKTEWDGRAKLKKCNKIMKHCMDSHEFVYHCLINTHINETLEVCARPIIAYGFCCEFNKRGKVIQIHWLADCTQFKVPCSDSYWSNSSYVLQGCYQLVYEERMRKDSIDIYETTTGTYIPSESFIKHEVERVSKKDEAPIKRVSYVAITVYILLFLV